MKKILLSLFALCAATSLWAYDFQSGLLYYNTLSDSTVEVTYRLTSGNNYSDLKAVTIPETVTYNGKIYTVVAIGSKAFATYPSSTSTPNAYDNATLKLINIPKTVKIIHPYAFFKCSALTTVNFLGDGLTTIGDDAFYDCSALTSFAFPQTLKTIDSNAFYDSALAGSVTIPDNVTSIGEYAFYSTNMVSLTIGNAVHTIGASAFAFCANLNSVIVGNAVRSISSSTFSSCTKLTSVTLGNSVATIGSSAFSSCTSLPSITLPKSVKSVEAGAFASCSKLTTVYLKPTTPPAFTNTNILPSSAKTFYVPCGTSETYFLSDWVNFTTNFQEEECIKKYTIYVNQDCTSSVVEE